MIFLVSVIQEKILCLVDGFRVFISTRRKVFARITGMLKRLALIISTKQVVNKDILYSVFCMVL